jgi:hypothetical protein
MPTRSRRERIAAIERALHRRLVDVLLVVQAPDGEEIFRVGGRWNRIEKRYVDGPCKETVLRLKWSQVPMAHDLGAYIHARVLGDDSRPAVLMAIGNRGGGKTWLLALFIVALALALPRTWQMAINLNAKNRREVDDAIKQVAPREWITVDVNDMRDARLEFVTGSGLFYLTAKNPGAMRMGQLKFENVLINEAQDQTTKVFSNACGAIRTGGCVTIATNGSQGLGGDWVVMLHQTIKAGEELNEVGGRDGVSFELSHKKNDAVHQPTMTKVTRLVRAVDPEAAAVDFDGVIKLSGDLGYPAFSRLPARFDSDGNTLRDEHGEPLGGHVGEPHPSWIDVTREETKKKAGAEFDYIGLSDFQKNPGSCLVASKLYRDTSGKLILYCCEFITTQGREADLSQACINRGYYPAGVDLDGRPAASMCIVGDATGDRQSASHRRNDPYSWIALRDAGGWTIIPRIGSGRVACRAIPRWTTAASKCTRCF